MAGNLEKDNAMSQFRLVRGEGRTKVIMEGQRMGHDLIVRLYNENAHLGAVAVGEYDEASGRASTSVITLLGHKDDVVAQKAAHELAKATMRPVCVIAGIHVDNITDAEIDAILGNCTSLIDDYRKHISGVGYTQ